MSSGFTSIWINQGRIRNRGFEFELNLLPLKTKDFEWALSGNISFNRNEIEDIGTDSDGKAIFITPDAETLCNYYVSGSASKDNGILKVDKRNSFNNNIDFNFINIS